MSVSYVFFISPPQPSPGGRGRKKPWRYRWPDEFRDEVLARLLELNKQRAEKEAVTGVAAGTERPERGVRNRAAKTMPRKIEGQPDLPGM